ncbi:hypothetical protein AB6E91_00270 [Staphylococcus saprophyticus]|uniref:hypothetical protein n=1 Tax=Staphylococcus TaxID=1279 RepID=UPI0004508FF3|nr:MULTISPECIES: hypothetical protein [Staphylococcus]EZS55454.1 hypothetical protein W531_01993 [Staphylococcus aureus VET0251R]KAA35198.1 hypothetical protein W410_02265 [Staphylococcus aureus VET0076R]KAC89054.1 hypothetical protein W543_02219 [Staphylococcus aureus VET0270R]KAC93378.1 hypothetical protein W544_02171 [Staphylococcus aureus VET0271R]KAE28292.1 hypothetical protein W605_02217 [Staphylococcus aureus VET0357R]MDW4255803.1 hypothetical protein [Staphylococcus saprophyticus]
MKIKGVSKENHLLVSIPSEFSYATNFYLFGYIVNPPKLLVKIRGETLSGNEFTDEIEIQLQLQRFKLSYNPFKAEITLFA